MKYLCLSDIHGVLKYAKEIDNIIKRENPNKIIILGDLFYHGTNKQLHIESMEVCNILNKYKDKIMCIRGNCDTDIDELTCEFEFNDYIKIEINNKKFFFTHGHLYDIYNVSDIDIFIHGHKHTGFIKELNNKLYINTGSLSLPRNNTLNSYLIIDDNTIYLKSIMGDIIDKIIYV